MPLCEASRTVCVGCKKSVPRKYKQKTKHFCSKACWLKRRRELWAEQHPRLEPPSIPCGVCGKLFQTKRNVWYKQKYCSRRCKDIGYKARQTAFLEKHPRIRAEYHRKLTMQRKWNSNWWKALQRDSFTCQVCGYVGDESQMGKKLAIHHRDGNGGKKGNHALENMLTVCAACHQDFHRISLLWINGEWQLSGSIFAKVGIQVPRC